MLMNNFEQKISEYLHKKGLHSVKIETIQVNIGLLCNHKCAHCHLEASPHRTEIMEWPTMQKIIKAAKRTRGK